MGTGAGLSPGIDEVVRRLLADTAGVTGTAYFEALARSMAGVLGTRYGIVGELLPGGRSVRTLAVWGGEGFLPGFEYDLDGTPCDLALDMDVCQHPDGVARKFPRDLLLTRMGIESYFGIPIHASDGRPLGILVALHDAPHEALPEIEATFGLFALKAGAEIERVRTETALSRSEALFRALVEHSSDAMALLGLDGVVRYASPGVTRLLGWPAEELVGRSAFDIVLPGDRESGAERLRRLVAQEGTAPPFATRRYRLQHQDGRERICETTTVNLLGVDEVGGLAIVLHDVTGQAAAQAALEERLAFETFLSELSSRLLSVPGARVEDELRIWSPRIAELLGAEEAEVRLVPEGAGGFEGEVGNGEALLPGLPWIETRVRAGESVRCGLGHDLPGDAEADRRALERRGIICFRAAPLGTRDALRGVLILTCRTKPCPWTPGAQEKLPLLASVLAAALERRSVEEALRVSESRYRALISQSSDAVFVHDPHTGRIQEANPRFLRLLDAAPEALSHLRLHDVFDGDPEELDATVETIRSRGELSLGERRIRRSDGRLVDVEVTSSLVTYRGRGVVLFNVRDIAERKSSEAALLRLTGLYELILRSAGEGILGLDRDGTHTFVNPAAARLLGFAPAELLGHHSHGTWHHHRADGSVYPPSDCPILASVREGEVRRVSDEVFFRKDGTSFLVEYVATPIFDGGRQTGAVVVFRDTSKEARLESIAEAVETMNSLGFVFSAVRHELGNPVNSVKMALSVLRTNLERLPHEKVAEYLDRSLAELSRVEDLLVSLKHFSLYENLSVTSLDLDEFLDRFTGVFAHDYEGRGISVRVVPSEPAGRVHADARALRQVLLNLLANSADALDGRPEPAIRIRTFVADGIAGIRVEDNGCGMPEEVRANLFKPFHTTKPTGTGLGLVIARKMMARMGGTVEVESRKGTGTTVVLTLRPDDGQ